MRKSGFFTRTTAAEARAAARVKTKPAVPTEDIAKIGPVAVRGMNPDARSPEMEPTGPTNPLVYILGEAPGEIEDQRGEPFVGKSGQLLREALPAWGKAETVFDNVVRTRPPDNRTPKPEEVAAFRRVVTESIERAQPNVILGFGNTALKWAVPLDRPNIKAARGKKFPIRVGSHTCWFCPTLHPAYLLRIEGSRDDKVPSDEWFRFWQQDIHKAYQLADDIEAGEADFATVQSIDTAAGKVVHCLTIEKVEKAVKVLRRADAIGFDIEGHRLRPYHSDSMFLSLALSDGQTTFSIPIDHPESPWVRDMTLQRPVLFDLLRDLVLDGPTWVAHNLPHDFEWMLRLLGPVVFQGRWGCSHQAAFVLNPGPPGMGAAGHKLDDLCLEHFGLPLKSLSPGAKYVTRLRELPLAKVLDYNALDAKWCLRLWLRLMSLVKSEGQLASYKLQIARVAPIVNAQAEGVPIDQSVRKKLEQDVTTQLNEVLETVASDPDVRAWEKKSGTDFNAGSPTLVGQLLHERFGVESVKSKKGYNTSVGVLEPLRGEVPIVADVLKYRGLSKLLGTYVQRFDPAAEDSYVYPDGKIHCNFSIARARTFRLASDDPNNQNWPKRKNKHVREQLAAPEGHVYVAVDQGQIEARVLAMESCDPIWVQMIEDNYDVHEEWAIKIAEIDGPFADLLEREPGKARHKAKNGWVFPSFYGSSLKSIISTLELEDEEAADELFKKFWSVFAGVKKWQRLQWKKYERDGFVTSLTGRRRWGPLSYNMVINTPIQGCASDICVDAMDRLFWRSREERQPWLAPLLQIHDDLTFIVPEEHLSEAIAVIVEEQLGFEAPWVNVPLSVEVEIGSNLAEMEAVGEWTSADLRA